MVIDSGRRWHLQHDMILFDVGKAVYIMFGELFGVKATVAPSMSSGTGISLRDAGHAPYG